jgi:dihydroorotase
MLLTLVEQGTFDLNTALAAVSQAPSEVLALNAGTLTPGVPADICVFDPHLEWTVKPQTLISAGRNTPFMGQTLRGRVTLTLVDGRVVHNINA